MFSGLSKTLILHMGVTKVLFNLDPNKFSKYNCVE